MAYVHIVVRDADLERARATYGRVIWGSDAPDPNDFQRVYVHADAGREVLRAVVTRVDQDQEDWLPCLGEGFEVHVLAPGVPDPVEALHARMAERGYAPAPT